MRFIRAPVDYIRLHGKLNQDILHEPRVEPILQQIKNTAKIGASTFDEYRWKDQRGKH